MQIKDGELCEGQCDDFRVKLFPDKRSRTALALVANVHNIRAYNFHTAHTIRKYFNNVNLHFNETNATYIIVIFSCFQH